MANPTNGEQRRQPVRFSPRIAKGLQTVINLVIADLACVEESDKDEVWSDALRALAWLSDELARRKQRHRRRSGSRAAHHGK